MTETTQILPAQTTRCATRWCISEHDKIDAPLSEQFHMGAMYAIPVTDNDGPFHVRLFNIDGDKPAIEVLSPHGDPYDLSIAAAWDLAQIVSMLAEQAEAVS